MTRSHQDFVDLTWIADPQTEAILLPTSRQNRDNSRKISHYKKALRQAIRNCLSPRQQEQVRLYYEVGLSKSEIARQQATTCSAVSRSMQAAEQELQKYIELYMQIYDQVEQDFLKEENGR